MTLDELNDGEFGVITKIRGRGAFRKRILEMGFVVGESVQSVKKAPLADPVEYKIMDYEISLRNKEAQLIEIVTENDAKEILKSEVNGKIDDSNFNKSVLNGSKTINVALVGNPNAGKTTIFNVASKSRERVGNYSGVTVTAKLGVYKLNGYTFNLIDLPGTYSITSYTPEELYVREYIMDNAPDIVVNVIDSSNLKRNLYLTTQLIDMDVKVVAALNMYDELEDKGDKLDVDKLSRMLGIPFVPTVGSKGKGIEDLFNKIISVYECEETSIRHITINYGHSIERAVEKIQTQINSDKNHKLFELYSPRFLALKLLEKDDDIKERLKIASNYDNIISRSEKEINILESDYKYDTESLLTDRKYGFISGALKQTYQSAKKDRMELSRAIDTVLTNKYIGIPIFLFFMWLTFYVTFTLGSLPMDLIESGVQLTSDILSNLLGQNIFRDLLVDGILGGVGGVIIFLPNILLLFFFISLMEDTGYMARAVFIMDKGLQKIGLHGKSFIPLLMGFGCNVPAIMASRIVDSKKDRIMTILINPFMSCSARLPVYVLIISAFFVNNQGTILFSMYFIGVVLAVLSAILFKKTLFKESQFPFVMELPPYRMPTWKSIFRNMWFRAAQFLKKVGGLILVASMIIWFLSSFPRNIELSQDYESQISSVEKDYKINSSQLNESDKEYLEKLNSEKERKINNIEHNKENERQEKSYLGRLGKIIEPVLAPLGFEWRMSVSLLAGLAAKEVVVSTLGVLYQADENVTSDNPNSLVTKLQNAKHKTGPKAGTYVFNPLIAFSYMLFVLIYFPCISVVAAIKNESGSWKWALFSVVYTTSLAWVLTFVVYNVGNFIFY